MTYSIAAWDGMGKETMIRPAASGAGMSATSIRAELRALWRRGLRPGSTAAYGFAATLAALATLVRMGLGLIEADLMPFATYYPAILLATFVGGVAAGILTLVLGGVIAWWLFLAPAYMFFPIS